MAALDHLEVRFGREIVTWRTQSKITDWFMTAGRKSPRYTTCWHEIPTAR
ncbi:DUF4113 domain-containing protein [Thalassospira marina]|uniref:DUF4113 domain-containing protein n=1 Tax=Thalassospira marina TaxID=2048283 RepID=A0A2N3KII7_9PROT|nr:hypothetical protein COO20_21060 [Thalassospira marina]